MEIKEKPSESEPKFKIPEIFAKLREAFSDLFVNSSDTESNSKLVGMRIAVQDMEKAINPNQTLNMAQEKILYDSLLLFVTECRDIIAGQTGEMLPEDKDLMRTMREIVTFVNSCRE